MEGCKVFEGFDGFWNEILKGSAPGFMGDFLDVGVIFKRAKSIAYCELKAPQMPQVGT